MSGFKIVSPPDFDVAVDVVAPGGAKVGQITLTCAALRRSQFEALTKDGMREDREVLAEFVRGWDAEAPFGAEALADLCDQFPRFAVDAFRAFTHAWLGQREGN